MHYLFFDVFDHDLFFFADVQNFVVLLKFIANLFYETDVVPDVLDLSVHYSSILLDQHSLCFNFGLNFRLVLK